MNNLSTRIFGLLLAVPSLATAATYSVTSTADSGAAGTLRWAINQANAHAGADTVTFGIGGAGVKTIAPASALPTITQAVTIDATTQAGYAGSPLIEINGTGAGSGVSGLVVSADNVVVKGLAINRFAMHGILINGGSGTTVTQCFIGVGAGGSSARGNGHSGVFMANTGGHTIGPGNVISGNLVDGVRLDAGGAAGIVVKGNKIGTNAAGSVAVANGFNGIVLTNSAHGNVIGGNTAAELNVVSGNTKNGIGLASGANGNLIAHNYVGIAADGAATLGNGLDGIILTDAPSNKVGGDIAGTFNIISANGKHGVEITASGADGTNSDGNLLQRNIIGSDLSGKLDRGNTNDGVNINAGGGTVSNTVIGGGAWGAGGNLISGNAGSGIALSRVSHTLIRGNRIGTEVSGTAALANGGNGVDVVDDSSYTSVGEVGAGNLISGNDQNGVLLNANDATVVANLIGTDATGSIAIRNFFSGLQLGASTFGYCYNTIIGGSWGSSGNLISGNTGAGILVYCYPTILGNRIGTDINGANKLPNNTGILIAAGGSPVIGRSDHDAWVCNRACNLISGNNGDGVRAIANSNGSGSASVLGNFIGSNSAGTQALGNSASGVTISNGTIGGSNVGEGNLISGNSANGIVTNGTGSFQHAAIGGNRIGTNAAGSAALANGQSGIRVTYVTGADIGGEDRGGGVCDKSCNLVSGNGGAGVYMDSNSYALDHAVHGNFIGTNLSGSGCIGNVGDGIRVDNHARLTIIGGTVAAAMNRIACNGGSGISVRTVNNYLIAISPNEIYDNGGLGIDLGNDGVTPNDAGDSDAGPNLLYNFPTLTSATSAGAGTGTVIAGTIASEGGTSFHIDYYSSPSCDASGHGEGRFYLGRKDVTTDGAGNANVDKNFATLVPVGNAVTAVATEYGVDPDDGNSSEFSQCVVVACTPPPAPTASNSGPVCSSQALALGASIVSGASYQWTGPNGFTSTQQNPLIASATTAATGTYSVRSIVNSCPSAAATTGAIVNACALSVADASISEGNSGTQPENFSVTLDHASTQPVSVQWATTNGTAVAPGDFVAASGTLTFSANQTSKTIAVNVVGDTLDEANETFKVSLSNASAGSISRAQATGTIIDDDTAGTLQFSAASYSVAESGSSKTITVTRAGGSASGVSVHYATANGTATAGADYTATSGTLSFGAGETSKTFNVPILNDVIAESTESLNLSLSAPSGGATLGALSSATLTISDDDAGNGEFAMSECVADVSELLAQIQLSVERRDGSNGAVSVHYATANGSAMAGSDYTATSGTLNWASGDAGAKIVNVGLILDPAVESTEQFELVLSQPSGGASIDTANATNVIILDYPDALFRDNFDGIPVCPP